MLKTMANLILEVRKSVQCISAQQGITQCKAENGVLLDVREAGEFEQKSAANAVNIPRGILEMKVLEQFPDANQPLYLHCARGAERPWLPSN